MLREKRKWKVAFGFHCDLLSGDLRGEETREKKSWVKCPYKDKIYFFPGWWFVTVVTSCLVTTHPGLGLTGLLCRTEGPASLTTQQCHQGQFLYKVKLLPVPWLVGGVWGHSWGSAAGDCGVYRETVEHLSSEPWVPCLPLRIPCIHLGWPGNGDDVLWLGSCPVLCRYQVISTPHKETYFLPIFKAKPCFDTCWLLYFRKAICSDLVNFKMFSGKCILII